MNFPITMSMLHNSHGKFTLTAGLYQDKVGIVRLENSNQCKLMRSSIYSHIRHIIIQTAGWKCIPWKGSLFDHESIRQGGQGGQFQV